MKELSREVKFALATKDFPAALAAGYTLHDAREAGYTLSETLAAGYPLSEAMSAGYTLHEARAAGYSVNDAEIPLIERPYTRMWEDIQAKRRIHKQSTWGPRNAPVRDEHLCGTAMCTAGHLVQMGGELGWKLQEKYGFAVAATLIHYKAHPDQPCQDFGAIPDDFSLVYIETMAEIEAARPVADSPLLSKEQG